MGEKEEQKETRRLNALKSYELLDSVKEKEYDDLTELAAQLCGTPIALVSLVDSDRQWFKSAHGTDLKQTARSTSICSTAIENPSQALIVEDARKDSRFNDYEVVTGSTNVVFYAGVPLVDADNFALGTLCVIDHVERQLSEAQIKGLRTLASNVVNLIELRKKNKQLEEEKKSIIAALELNSAFYLILDLELHILVAGSNFNKILPEFSLPAVFDDFFQFEGQFTWTRFIENEMTEYNKLLFMKVKDRNQRYKCSAKRVGNELILSCSPVINAQFSLKDYHLTINDFAQHDYIAEYLFLQQTTNRSLEDSRNLTQKLLERNRLLEEAQKDIDALSRFPQENPNAILRFDFDFNLMYFNKAATVNFLSDFNIEGNTNTDDAIRELLIAASSQDTENATKVLSRNGRHYSVTAIAITENSYINIYVKDITTYVEEVKHKEAELSKLKDEIGVQKDFYEFILNNIPADIGVFDKDHKYVFVNPQGIKNPEIRNFMIGKDDFDYCVFKGIPDDMARSRRAIFNSIIESRKIVSWEDEIINKEGERIVILREMAPLFDEYGEVKYVVGYGINISDRKNAEDELKKANERMTLLQNFLNKTSDAIQVADTEGNIIYLNNTASKRLGIQIEKTNNYHVTDFETSFKEPGSWIKHVDELRALGEMQLDGKNINQETGEVIHVEVSIKFEEIDDKEYVIAASRDITERKKTEERDAQRNYLLMERQRALVDLSQLSSHIPIDERLKLILRRNAEIIDVARVGFWQLSENQDLIICDHLFELKKNDFIESQQLFASDFPEYFEQMKLNDGMIIAHDTYYHPATQHFKESYLKPNGIRSMLDIPVRIGERILGVLSHEHIGDPREWQEDEITFTRSIADLVALTLENSEREKAEKALVSKSIFQNLLMELSTKYINLPVEEVDDAINVSLEKIGNFVDVDRVYIFHYLHESKTCSCIYEWCGDGISEEIENLQEIPYEDIPIWYEAHAKGKVYHVPNVTELTDAITKEILEPQGIKSMIAFPLMQGDLAIGFVGFDSVKTVRDFSEDERSLLELYSQMLANVNMRIDQLREIELSKQAIEQINHDLEAIVLEKTKANLELAKSITDQEKLVTLGEISSGIAHDLNTPLGAIKSGAESVRFTLEQLFKGSIWKCSEDQIMDACNIAIDAEDDLFIGGLQQMRETKAFEEMLRSNYSNNLNENEIHPLAVSLVKSRIQASDKIFIEKAIATENRLDYLEVIFQMKTIRTLVDTILKSSDRAARVVQDLRSFIKEQKNTQRTTIDLKQNIGTVLNIFNFELNRVANVEFTLTENCFIEGYDIKLFQLWSNLIKNAIEAMEETENRGILRIFNIESKSGITIVVENNGPKIPDEIQSEIFNKFYTTKSEKNGTGLGLNIVKNVIQDHNAKIELDSTDERTQFKITFAK